MNFKSFMNNKNQINHPQVKKNFQKSKSLNNKLIEKAELEANKAQNIIDYNDYIFNKPKK